MTEFVAAVGNVLQPMSIMFIFIGALAGILVGAMPGLSSITGLSLLLPFTFTIPGGAGILMLLGVFCGAIYGGSITAILINTPGTANSAATCLDGYPMAKKLGQPGRALGISTMASTIGGLFSAIMLLATAPLLAKVALHFGSPEYFALAIFGLSIVTSISSKSVTKSLIGAILGLLLATVGMDSLTGNFRFTFDYIYMSAGIAFVPLLIALYAFAQALMTLEEGSTGSADTMHTRLDRTLPHWADVRRVFPTIMRSSTIGVIIGAIPGTGGDIASWVSYNEAKRWAKNPEEFGTGVPEGIAAPEAANNAISGGALIPLLTLGIPGDAGTAVMLGALMMQGLIPGPLLFTEQGVEVYSIIVGLLVANLCMGILGFAGLRWFAKIPSIPGPVLMPLIFVFCFIGAYSLSNNVDDIFFMIIAGIIGFVLIKLDFSVPPIILGLILGNLIEKNLARSLMLSDGSFMIFIERPIALVLLVIAFISLAIPLFRYWKAMLATILNPKETA